MNEYDDKALILTAIFTIIVLAFLFFVLLPIAKAKDEKLWNDGHCTCGGSWVYEQAVGYRYTTIYMYHCDRCGAVIEIGERR